jgi:hypothetical protein
MAYTTIDDPSAHFQTKAYSGSGTTQSITNDGNSDLQPDWLWIKSRDGTYDHEVVDSTRGTTKYLYPNLTNAENTSSTKVTSFNSDGFTLNSLAGSPFNSATNTYVAWQWKANGGTTSSNTDGTLTSTVQANTDAGFSIVTFTTDGTTKTVGHGLGVKPDIVLVKSRSAAGSWIFITDIVDGSMDYGVLNSTAAFSAIGYNPPTSSVFEYNDNNTYTQVAYCFAEKQGFSKFGSYKGLLGSTRPVYTGFKPAFVMIKRTDSATNAHWIIMDSERGTYNSIDTEKLYANVNNSEASLSGDSTSTDFYSNGFRIAGTYTGVNSAGATYIYMAFAENPFVTSTGIPTTAR